MRSHFCLSSLLLACVPLGLFGCGGVALDQLSDDTTAIVFLDAPVVADLGGFASLRLEGPSCFQVPEDTAATLNDIPASEFYVGGRGGNPLAAYIDVGCSQPSATWFLETSLLPPYVFALSAGGVTVELELDEDFEVARCEFPACVSEAAGREEP